MLPFVKLWDFKHHWNIDQQFCEKGLFFSEMLASIFMSSDHKNPWCTFTWLNLDDRFQAIHLILSHDGAIGWLIRLVHSAIGIVPYIQCTVNILSLNLPFLSSKIKCDWDRKLYEWILLKESLCPAPFICQTNVYSPWTPYSSPFPGLSTRINTQQVRMKSSIIHRFMITESHHESWYWSDPSHEWHTFLEIRGSNAFASGMEHHKLPNYWWFQEYIWTDACFPWSIIHPMDATVCMTQSPIGHIRDQLKAIEHVATKTDTWFSERQWNPASSKWERLRSGHFLGTPYSISLPGHPQSTVFMAECRTAAAIRRSAEPTFWKIHGLPQLTTCKGRRAAFNQVSLSK